MGAPNELPALQAFHRQWNGGAPVVDEAEKHRFTQAFVEQVLAPKDPRWGRKSRAAGAGPISKDTVAYWLGPDIPTEPTDGPLDARDLLTSWGADTWNADDDPAYNNIQARWYPVTPVANPQVTVAPPKEITPEPRHEEIEELLAGIEQRIRDHVDASIARMATDLRAALEGLPASVADAVNTALEKQLSETHAHIKAMLAELPKEYELRYLGRVVGTMAPKV